MRFNVHVTHTVKFIGDFTRITHWVFIVRLDDPNKDMWGIKQLGSDRLQGSRSLYAFAADVAYTLMKSNRLTDDAEALVHNLVIGRMQTNTTGSLPVDLEEEWQGIESHCDHDQDMSVEEDGEEEWEGYTISSGGCGCAYYE